MPKWHMARKGGAHSSELAVMEALTSVLLMEANQVQNNIKRKSNVLQIVIYESNV